MSVALLVITDGRDDYLSQCVDSLGMLVGDITERWMYDDTGDDAYRATLAERYPQWTHFNAGPRQGCAGAFQACWRHLRDHSRARYVFLIEGDFVFLRPVDLTAMAALLDERPYLVEVALRRQPWNGHEIAAGGVVELHPGWYTDMVDEQGRQWLEQTAFFTTNPCLFRHSLLSVDWPGHQPGRFSESTFHQTLKRDGTPEASPGQTRYAYWGARDSGVWVQHIGAQRIGKDY